LHRHDKRSLRRKLRKAAWALFGAGGFVLTFYLIHAPDGPQHWSSDLVTAFLSQRPATQDPRIALITVSDETLRALPYISPIDRKLLADVVRAAAGAGAKAIGLDFVFDRASEPAKDDALIAAIHDAGAPVVVGALDQRSPLSADGRDYQTQFLARSGAPPGHLYFDEKNNPLVISDHVIRAIAPASAADGTPVSFAQALVRAAGSPRTQKSPQISWLLGPRDGTETFLTLPAEQVLGLGGLHEPLPLKQMLGGRIVIIGGVFDDRDQHLTPLSLRSGAPSPGMFIHAQVLAQILDGRALRSPGQSVDAVLMLAAAALGFWIGRRRIAERYHRAMETAAALALVLTSVFCFVWFDFQFPFTTVFLGGMVGVIAGHYIKPVRT
jgi:adenylate cyclase